MGRIFIDGFESGGSDLWDTVSGTTIVSSAGLDMDGSYCASVGVLTNYLEKNIVADDEMYFALLWRATSTSGKGVLTAFNGSTALISITNAGGGALQARSGTGYTLIATGSHTLSTNTTYLIEIRIKIADSGGRIEVKVDGASDIDFTGDTKPDANTQFDKVRLGYTGNSSTYAYAYMDNFIMDDAGWIGDTNIQAVVPTGAGTTTGWTPSAGANWECVDEIPASDADYVSINVNDVTDTYATGNMVGTVGSVKCVQIQSRTRTEGAPTPTNLKLVARSGGADYLSGNKAISMIEKGLWNLWENNPADSAAWEETDVNNMEIGFRSAA